MAQLREYYAESQSILGMSFHRAKGIYEKDVAYETTHRGRYETRHNPIRIIAFTVLVLILALLLFILVFNLDSSSIAILAPIVVISAILLREFYYAEVGLHLVHTENRMSSFLSRLDVNEKGEYTETQQIDFNEAMHEPAPELNFVEVIKELQKTDDEFSENNPAQSSESEISISEPPLPSQADKAENPYKDYQPPEERPVEPPEEPPEEPDPPSQIDTISLTDYDVLLNEIVKSYGLGKS